MYAMPPEMAHMAPQSAPEMTPERVMASMPPEFAGAIPIGEEVPSLLQPDNARPAFGGNQETVYRTAADIFGNSPEVEPRAEQVPTQQSVQSPAINAPVPQPISTPGTLEPSYSSGLSPELAQVVEQLTQGNGLYGQVFKQVQELVAQAGSEEAVLDQMYAPDANEVVASVDAELAAKYERSGMEYDPTNDPQQAIMREMLYEQRYNQAFAQSRTTRQAQAQAAQAREQAISGALSTYPYADAALVRQVAAQGLDPLAMARQMHAAVESRLSATQQAQAAQSHPARKAPVPLSGVPTGAVSGEEEIPGVGPQPNPFLDPQGYEMWSRRTAQYYNQRRN